MSVVDPRELGDREMLAFWLLGALPRRGWPGRRRLIVRRVLLLVGIAIAVAFLLEAARWLIVLTWAMSL